ncbi:SseB family protein [Gephyromycinifex aptenodytis]|uniref:SseB family protein n=1 Tax=Gephyromycinifex aptenodytis TaxID=2716227 RepID=UPI00144667FB|nr:SseB family protein [Gephyromycinifex aptenodytis]
MSTDSAGQPFAGRELRESGFADDRGDSDPRVLQALRALQAQPGNEREAALLQTLAGTRLIVPVVTAPGGAQVWHHGGGDEDEHPAGGSGAGAGHHETPPPEVSGGAEMATVVLTAPDGRRALPVFTGVETMKVWDESARPVPVQALDVARSSIEDGCDTMLLDLDSPHAAALRLSHVWALAQERTWQPGHADQVVRLAVAEAAQGLAGLVRAEVEDGSQLHGPGVLRLVLLLRAGLSHEEVDHIVHSMGEALARDPEVRIRVDDLAVVVHQAEAAAPNLAN